MNLRQYPAPEQVHTIHVEILNSQWESFRIPVNPEEFPQNHTSSWADRDVIGRGETSYALYPKLSTLNWNSFFPKSYDPTYCVVEEEKLLDPLVYERMFLECIKRNRVVKLIVTNMELIGLYTVRSFVPTRKGGEPLDIYYEIQFKEYAQGSIRRFSGDIVPTNPGLIVDISTIPGFPKTQSPDTEDRSRRRNGASEPGGTNTPNDNTGRNTGRAPGLNAPRISYNTNEMSSPTLRKIVFAVYKNSFPDLKLAIDNGLAHELWAFNPRLTFLLSDTVNNLLGIDRIDKILSPNQELYIPDPDILLTVVR